MRAVSFEGEIDTNKGLPPSLMNYVDDLLSSGDANINMHVDSMVRFLQEDPAVGNLNYAMFVLSLSH